jgi:hypothetical protein
MVQIAREKDAAGLLLSFKLAASQWHRAQDDPDANDTLGESTPEMVVTIKQHNLMAHAK